VIFLRLAAKIGRQPPEFSVVWEISMPISSSIAISHSVGRGGRNLRADVMAVQIRLNELMHPPKIRLAVDGHAGPKTEAMIADFQRVVLG
jgi:hypothetical protein